MYYGGCHDWMLEWLPCGSSTESSRWLQVRWEVKKGWCSKAEL